MSEVFPSYKTQPPILKDLGFSGAKKGRSSVPLCLGPVKRQDHTQIGRQTPAPFMRKGGSKKTNAGYPPTASATSAAKSFSSRSIPSPSANRTNPANLMPDPNSSAFASMTFETFDFSSEIT